MSGPPRPVTTAREWAARAGIIPWYAGGRAFSPLDLPGLRLWLDASDPTTITESSGAVSQWDDKSPQGSAATQATASLQPSLVAEELNGKPVMRFVADYLDVNDVSMFRDAAVATLFAVAKPQDSSNRHYFMGASTTSSNSTRFGALSSEVDTIDRFGIGGRRLDADSFSSAAAAISHGQAWHVAVWEIAWVDAVARLRQDGVDVATIDPFQTAGRTSDTDSSVVRVGALTGTTNANYNGDIAELLVYVTEERLTPNQVSTVERYLAKKWGLTLS